jgi:hypothetical protein
MVAIAACDLSVDVEAVTVVIGRAAEPQRGFHSRPGRPARTVAHACSRHPSRLVHICLALSVLGLGRERCWQPNMQGLQLKPTVGALSSTRSSFRGVTAAFQRLSVAPQPVARQQLVVEGERRSGACHNKRRDTVSGSGGRKWPTMRGTSGQGRALPSTAARGSSHGSLHQAQDRHAPPSLFTA